MTRSKTAKIVWTTVVISIALAAVVLILVVGPVLERWLESGLAPLGMP